MVDVGILFKALGAEGVLEDAKNLDKAIQKLRGKDVTLDFGASRRGLEQQKSALTNINRLIDAQRTKILQTNRIAKNSYKKLGTDALKSFNKATIRRGGLIDKSRLRQAMANTRSQISAMGKEMSAQISITPKINWSGAFKTGKSIMGMIGTSLETIGNGISQLANNPINEIFTGMFRQIGVGMSNLMYEGFSSSIQRFDTFRTFPKIMMRMFGKSAESTAKWARDYLNENVLGLPTGLDEIVREAQRYISAMGDIQKGSRLAVAANNAFLASSSDARDKYLGQRQLRNLAQGMALTKTQWDSLAKTIPGAMTTIAKSMGYKSGGALLSALKENQITEAQFLDALIASGNEGGAVYGMAREMIDTMSASIENIKNAFSRLGQGFFEVIDEALLATTGKGLPGTIKDVTTAIDGFAQKAKDWIKANPDQVKKWVDTIKSIDFEAFIKGFGKGFIKSVDRLMTFVKLIGRNEGKIGSILGKAGIYGRMITFAGQMIKGASPLGGAFGMLGTLLKTKMLGNVIRGEGLFSGILPKFFKGVGKTAKAVEEVPVASVGKFVGLSSKMSTFFVSLGAITAVAGTAVAVTGSILAIGKMMEAIGKININGKQAVKTLGEIGAFITVLSGIGLGLGKAMSTGVGFDIIASIEVGLLALGTLVTTIGGFAVLDTWLFKKASENIVAMTEAIKTAITNINTIQATASGLSLNSSTIEGVREAIAQISKMAIKPEGGGRYSWFDKRGSKNVQELTSNFTTTVESVVSLVKSLNKVGEINEGSTKRVKKVAKFMSDFYKEIGNWSSGKPAVESSSNFAEVVSNFKTSITTIGDVLKAYGDMKDNLLAITRRHKSGGSDLGTMTGAIKRMVTSMGEILKVIHRDYVFKYTDDIAEDVTNMNTAMTNIGKVITAMRNMEDDLSYLFTANKKGKTKGGGISENIKSLISEMATVFATFKDAFNTQDFNAKSMENIASQAKSIKIAITAIGSIASAYLKMQSDLAKLGQGSGVQSSGMGGKAGAGAGASMTNGALVTSQIGTMIGQIKTVATQLEGVPDIGGVQSNIKTLNDALSGFSSLIGKLVSIKAKFDENDPTSTISKIKSTISQLAGAFGGNAGGVGGKAKSGGGMNIAMLGAQFQILASAVDAFASSMLNLSGKALTSVVSGLNSIKKTLNALDGSFRTKGASWAKALISGFRGVGINAQISVLLGSALRTRDYSANGYSTGLSYVNGVRSAIASLAGLNVNIPVTLSRGGRSNGGSYIDSKGKKHVYTHANGGLIYADSGRFIGFAPKGTDTVPAMLTPGEFVQRKSAVNHFGTRFMERINNLDLVGALNSLSLRAGRMAMPVGSPTIINNTNNTRNNNANVTQHIHTAKERIAYKHADRYVRAL